MAYKVVWSSTALEDIEAIAGYISRDSLSYAGTVVTRIIDSTRKLEKCPFAGRVVPEFGSKTLREVFAYNYRIIYRIRGDKVTVAAVIHGRREL